MCSSSSSESESRSRAPAAANAPPRCAMCEPRPVPRNSRSRAQKVSTPFHKGQDNRTNIPKRDTDGSDQSFHKIFALCCLLLRPQTCLSDMGADQDLPGDQTREREISNGRSVTYHSSANHRYVGPDDDRHDCDRQSGERFQRPTHPPSQERQLSTVCTYVREVPAADGT